MAKTSTTLFGVFQDHLKYVFPGVSSVVTHSPLTILGDETLVSVETVMY